MKYHNKKTRIDNVTFDSKKEANRYRELKLLEKAQVIKRLELQPRFVLQLGFTDSMGNKHREIVYVADFKYWDCEKKQEVVEDVKGVLTPTYKIKKKLLLYAYQDMVFREI